MKKISKTKNKKSSTLRIVLFFVLVVAVIIIIPYTPTNFSSFGASTIQFTPVPAKSSLQLETFQLTPTPGAQFTPQQGQPNTPQQPTQSTKPTQPGKTQPGNPFGPIGSTPVNVPAPAHPIISPFKSNGQLCSVTDNSGVSVGGNCYCPALQVTCKNGVGYGANGALYPGVNPCGTSAAPKSGRYCVEKPVIYLYPTTPTYVDVQVKTSGQVVVSNPHYPQDGWKDVLAYSNGSLRYQGQDYSELFYESSVNTFAQPQQGMTIPTSELSQRLPVLLDQLGLVGHEKEEFLSFWLPRLEALHSPYIFFSLINQSAKADIDSVTISPKPDTQIAFIAYFKRASVPSEDTLKLPPTPKRQGFVSVEWGGVIGE
ncbi:MAG TPA: hypothetical protein VLF93_02890 [Candidatus Saccharimonadales bacterium]|nr:hypothetical protein [Candidatus Saccharimonadales bacterium]